MGLFSEETKAMMRRDKEIYAKKRDEARTKIREILKEAEASGLPRSTCQFIVESVWNDYRV